MVYVIIIVALLTGLLLFQFIAIYNALIALKNDIDRSWANVDVVLKQRFDEVPQPMPQTWVSPPSPNPC